MYSRARSVRSTVNFGSIASPFLKCSSAFSLSPPKSPGTSMATLPAREWARTERGLSCRRIWISSRTVGRRKSERSTPFVWISRQRPRRVVLAPVIVDAIDAALDVVLAHAAAVVITQHDAIAEIEHDVPAFVELRRLARMRESLPTQRIRQSG